MKRENFEIWLDAYGESWINRDLEAKLALFTEDASYMYTPFHKVMKGKNEIRRYIEKGSASLHENIAFEHEILAMTQEAGVSRWKASLTWKPTGQTIRFDGIYHVFLNEKNLCYRFDEWWHSVPPLPEKNAPE